MDTATASIRDRRAAVTCDVSHEPPTGTDSGFRAAIPGAPGGDGP